MTRPPAINPELNPADFDRIIRQRVDEEVGAEKIEAMRMRMEASERVKPKWWEDWTKPAPILAVAGILWGIFSVYQSDKANIITTMNDLRSSVAALSKQVNDNYQAASDRASKYVPQIEKLTAAMNMQELLNKQIQDRNDATIQSMQILRQSIEGLRDIQAKDHDELLIQKSRREGRTSPSNLGSKDPT